MNNFDRRIIASESVPIVGIKDRPIAERNWPIQYHSIEVISAIADLFTVILVGVSAGAICDLYQFGRLSELNHYFGAAIVVAAIFVPLMKNLRMYEAQRILSERSHWLTICTVWTSVLLLLSIAASALGLGSERALRTYLLFAIFGALALIVWRTTWRGIISKAMMQRRFSGRNVVLITDQADGGKLSISALLESHGFNLLRHFILPPASEGRQREQIISTIMTHACGSDVGEIIIGGDTNNWPELRGLVEELRVFAVPVSFVPAGPISEIFGQPSRRLGNTVYFELQRGPLSSLDRAAKRFLDVLAAGTALLALLPLFAVVAFAIKIDSSGPVFFKQRRCGFNGKYFTILKFRSMSVLDDGDKIVQAQKCDARITRVGKWLRRTSIDELPQLINVLEGSMSLIGPRPHAVAHDTQFNQLVENYAKRRRVKPGLSGWAQVNGCRGATPTLASIERRVELDLWYIDNWSFLLDLKIIFLTAVEVLRGNNAY